MSNAYTAVINTFLGKGETQSPSALLGARRWWQLPRLQRPTEVLVTPRCTLVQPQDLGQPDTKNPGEITERGLMYAKFFTKDNLQSLQTDMFWEDSTQEEFSSTDTPAHHRASPGTGTAYVCNAVPFVEIRYEVPPPYLRSSSGRKNNLMSV